MRSIFTVRDASESLLDWLKIESKDFIPGADTEKSTKEYVSISRKFSNRALHIFIVNALVPHPKFVESAEALLIRPFAELDPSIIKYATAETVTLNGGEGVLYQLSDGGYRLVIPCKKNSFVSIYTDTNLKSDLLKLALAMNLTEFNQQIES